MSASLTFTIVLTEVEGGWTQAQLREVPGVITCAPTESEAREAIADALGEYVASFAEDTEKLPVRGSTGALRVTIDAA